MRRTLWIVAAFALLVGVCFLPPPEKALAVADDTSGKDDCLVLAAGSADWQQAFETWYKPISLSVQAGTQDIYVKFNDESTTGKKIPAGQVMTWDHLKGLRSFTIDRSAADAGVLACWWQ